jgi:hypothetical protein
LFSRQGEAVILQDLRQGKTLSVRMYPPMPQALPGRLESDWRSL